jgi:RNA polymerase sigma factor (sigma-70 family)
MSGGLSDAVLKQVEALYGGDSVLGLSDGQLLARFAGRRREGAEAAFAALVARHGPMVFGVCLQLLDDLHDAEDAFQATFLVLARKVGSIRKPERLAPWLHGVARRTALKARSRRGPLLPHEAREAAMGAEPADMSAGPELRLIRREEAEVLHEEIDRLPETYRAAVVICDLEGLTHELAAQRLGWPASTVSMRVKRARERLKPRLTRRGLALPAGLLAAAVAPDVARAAVPAAWVDSAARAALRFSAERAVAAGTPAAALAEGVLRAMFLNKLKVVCMSGLAVAAVTAFGVMIYLRPGTAAGRAGEGTVVVSKVQTRQAPATATAPAEAQGEPIIVRGQVLDPQGRPVAGARLYLYQGLKTDDNPPVQAVPGADGRFQFPASPRDLIDARRPDPWRDVQLVAAAPGFGPNGVKLGKPSANGTWTIRLVKDDMPVEGRVLDPEGRPVEGVSIRPVGISGTDEDDLSRFVNDPARFNHSLYFTKWYPRAMAGLPESVRTWADGRFRLSGIGRERIVQLGISGPTVASESVQVMTRPGGPIRFHWAGYDVTIYGPRADFHTTPPGQVVGTVRDKETGKPIMGVRIRGGPNRATTDRQGRFRLSGLAKGPSRGLSAVPAAGAPYFPTVKAVGDAPGPEPVTADFVLKPGIWVVGRVTDKTTGQPASARVDYLPREDNPNALDVEGMGWRESVRTGDDGRFRVLALPGRGQVIATTQDDRYLLARDREDQVEVVKDEPNPSNSVTCHVYVDLDLKRGESPAQVNLTLVRGRSVDGTVLAPDGRPLTGTMASGIKPEMRWETIAGHEFSVKALSTRRGPRTILFWHEGLKLAGALELRGDEPGPVTARLEPWGTVSGRLVDASGKPCPEGAGAWLDLESRLPDVSRYGTSTGGVAHITQPGRDGRFRIEGLVPGRKYVFSAQGPEGRGPSWNPEGLSVGSGEDRDLGDVRPSPSSSR